MTPGTKPTEYYRDKNGMHPIFGADLAAHAALTNPHSAVAAATADRLVLRDAAGRAQVVAPSVAADIARKDTVDNLAGAGRTTETVKANADAIALKVPASRQIIAGVGLSGGGDLTADRTLTVAIPTLYIEDQKAANTAGGTFTSGAWQKRDLNTKVIDGISGASLASSQITLPAGTYAVRFSCPAFAVGRHKAKLYNTTASTDLVIGSSAYALSSTGGEVGSSFGFGSFILGVQSVLELRHRGTDSHADNGFGVESNFAVIEVYSQIEIRKTA